MKKLLCLILVMIAMFSTGCGVKNQKFTYENMSITLTSDFKETTAENFTVAYDSKNVAVLVLQEKFSASAGFGDLTLNEYAGYVLSANGKQSSELKTDNGLTYFEFEHLNTDNNTNYKYMACCYKGTDAFWLIQFACKSDQYDTDKDSMILWAQSVSFSN